VAAGATQKPHFSLPSGKLQSDRLLAFTLPFGEPSLVYEGDKMTATLKGQFVDYWERVR
jgi:hypothetical protein